MIPRVLKQHFFGRNPRSMATTHGLLHFDFIKQPRIILRNTIMRVKSFLRARKNEPRTHNKIRTGAFLERGGVYPSEYCQSSSPAPRGPFPELSGQVLLYQLEDYESLTEADVVRAQAHVDAAFGPHHQCEGCAAIRPPIATRPPSSYGRPPPGQVLQVGQLYDHPLVRYCR